ncbi:Pumilio-family RNA binding repeat domain protein [Talaromyces proteolyticus]|uniref:Pumilio-family RNA binding repeat domain protein n=1 Tax=Talaromyces proteolyticus TaxID=1131652 RepID=A0AAD4KGB9_9EURO|nr:Pumilio-family RNA binding repeat domain protein [Talaromyces proteolyticus]KAH8691105.1 Pumilio-family RNA binding repeat domain protein [Talaromyces proteolyticus]
MSSKRGNIQPKPNTDHQEVASKSHISGLDKILAKLSPKPQSNAKKAPMASETKGKPDDKRSLQSDSQQRDLRSVSSPPRTISKDLAYSETSFPKQAVKSSIAAPFMNNAESVGNTNISLVDTAEMLRLKQELIAANSRIAQQEQELAQTRVIKHTLDQALGPPSEADFGGREITDHTISGLQSAFNASAKAYNDRTDSWVPDDAKSDISESLSAGAYNRNRGLWTVPAQAAFGTHQGKGCPESPSVTHSALVQDSAHPWTVAVSGANIQAAVQQHRVFSGPANTALDGRYNGEQNPYLNGINFAPRRSITQMSRPTAYFPPMPASWAPFNGKSAYTTPSINSYQQVGLYQIPQYQPRPIGTPLSPTAAEFTSNSTPADTWTGTASTGAAATYVTPLEPINYRRLLDKNVSCDWKYIVDKIVCSSDQQASIFLQQKLKVGTVEQKYDIIEAIVNQAYPLMINRFGNFLVQRCFEHGTPEQVIAIANAIKGNTLSLSMDAFGCHVVQKAFDCVPEEHKAAMVHELLRRIPETVIHRYACHVWQKLFELRWNGEPPQIMTKVNESLRGMWHEVALGETGSLVVQNIFENCVEDEKRPAIEEVLANIDLLSHGQFGNWCIQHICEHGATHDKNRAIEHILHWSADYSMDQFASKVVEKCLKIGGPEFLDRYLARICTGRADRPRMPLIDISGDQYGNYLIQWILIHAAPHQRELVATHIRKHMVSLRGSKFGSRVAMLCCNPSHATRPGPGAGVQANTRYANSSDDRLQVSNSSGNRFNRNNSNWGPTFPPFR